MALTTSISITPRMHTLFDERDRAFAFTSDCLNQTFPKRKPYYIFLPAAILYTVSE